MSRRQIGTVRTLKLRIYPMDPAADVADPETPSVQVQPGEYPVYLEDGKIYWEMTGKANKAMVVDSERYSENLHLLTTKYDQTSGGGDVTVKSAAYEPQRFAGFLEDEMCLPGPQQRLAFTMDGPLPTGKRDRILSEIEHLTGEMFLYYGRKEDPELPVGSIEQAVAAGEISAQEIAAAFSVSFLKAFKP